MVIAARNPSFLKGILGCDLYSRGLAWATAVCLVAHGYTGFLCLGEASKDALTAMKLEMGWDGAGAAGCGLLVVRTGSAQRLSLISISMACVLPRGGSIQHTRKQAEVAPPSRCRRIAPVRWSCSTNRKPGCWEEQCVVNLRACGVVGHTHWVFGVLAEQLGGTAGASGAHKQKATRGGKFITRGKLKLCREVMGDGGVGSPGCSESWGGVGGGLLEMDEPGGGGGAWSAEPSHTPHSTKAGTQPPSLGLKEWGPASQGTHIQG